MQLLYGCQGFPYRLESVAVDSGLSSSHSSTVDAKSTSPEHHRCLIRLFRAPRMSDLPFHTSFALLNTAARATVAYTSRLTTATPPLCRCRSRHCLCKPLPIDGPAANGEEGGERCYSG
uniref:Uncharacterized protein n=1 Tax=Oryza glumipatula TaxID=40148 RepID=A0A0D9ZAL8_9ORYZ